VEPNLEVELQRELQDARIAHGARINAEPGRSEGGVGYDEVRLIEDVKEFRTEGQAVFFGECELLAELHIPILVKRSANNIPT
jgi:hypothetical protein